MKRSTLNFALTFCVLSLFPAFAESIETLNSTQIENLTGAKGEFDESLSIFKVRVPYKDLKVSTVGLNLTPDLGLCSWANFKKTGEETHVIGDMILFEDQVNPVMKVVLDNGLHITALCNHYLWDTPKAFFMHIEGKGSVNELATAVGNVFESIQTTKMKVLRTLPEPDIYPIKSTLDVRNIESILGTKGTLKEGVYKVVFERTKPLATLGTNSWVAFAGTDKVAAILGYFILEEDEAQNVLKSLIKNNILILSIHQQVIDEGPRILFVHYIKRGPAVQLARELKEIIKQTKAFEKEDTAGG